MNRTTSTVLDRMIDDAATDLAALKAENKRLREALRPFANIPCLENFDDDQSYDTSVMASDVRRARAALAAAPAGAGMR